MDNIEIRPLTILEYDAFREYQEDLEERKLSEEKVNRKLAIYVCQHILNIDLQDKNASVRKCMDLFGKVMDATANEQLEEEKN